MADDALLTAFLAGEIDNGGFRHADHVRVGFALLQCHDFPTAAMTFCGALKAIAARAGHAEAYHETITLGFLSLIAEGMAARAFESFAEFAAAHPELLRKDALARWYAPERLSSDVARKTFVLPGAVASP